MTKVLADQTLRSKLNDLKDHVEIHDESGKTLGHYIPSALYTELLYAWARALFADKEEYHRARREEGGLTTADLLAYLRSQAGAEKNGA
jgi:hypothetical protein